MSRPGRLTALARSHPPHRQILIRVSDFGPGSGRHHRCVPGGRGGADLTAERLKLSSMPSALRIRNVLGLLAAFVVTSMAGGVLAAGVAMPAVGASGMLTKNSADFFDSLPSDLLQPPLSEASRLLASDGSRI